MDALFAHDEMAETIAHIGVDSFRNYMNHIAGTEIDIPVMNVAATSRVA